MAYRHPDPDEHLKWLGTIGKWPEQVRDLGEEYAGNTCYRVKKAHVWLQAYYWDIPVNGPAKMWADCLQGRDSIFPGMMLGKVPTAELKHCDCGKWMTPTDEQIRLAEQRYKQALTKARRVLN